ncbi:enoyl-CoA hydratase-related protein [Planococcus salinus]|uniref:Enoyl-CoA hydratase n=1 Tax=Planococcus salinus TaxID=1848460 RepID=A0A3M8P7T9_9BACL|nr:enoyl-CoA hydratase-related protein [Planococcus salinus]RNF39745.1 enoyl-CoA hydratase [Planococcus salinus]
MGIIYERNENIAILSLFRENEYNALDYETICQLSNYLMSIKDNKNINVVIITAKGEKAFTVGADLKERREMNNTQVDLYIAKIRETYKLIESIPQIVIAAVNGMCIGGGTEMILACDLRIVAKQAEIGLPEVKIGIIPGAGGTQRLVQIVGLGAAKEMVLTGESISALKAKSIGLVNEVIEGSNILESAIEFSRKISKNAPLSIKEAKSVMNFAAYSKEMDGFLFESEAYSRLIVTKDRQEALDAFKNKRMPVFVGD